MIQGLRHVCSCLLLFFSAVWTLTSDLLLIRKGKSPTWQPIVFCMTTSDRFLQDTCCWSTQDAAESGGPPQDSCRPLTLEESARREAEAETTVRMRISFAQMREAMYDSPVLKTGGRGRWAHPVQRGSVWPDPAYSRFSAHLQQA